MLHQTAATTARVGAGRFHPLGRGGDDPEIGQRVLDQIALNLFTGQATGRIDRHHLARSVFGHGNAVPMVAQPVDRQFHASSSSVPMNPPDWRFQ